MVYGATGTTRIDRIQAALAAASVGGRLPGLAILGLGLMFVGLGFKVVIAPFQIYGPDVYEGAPTPVTALLASAPKAATFALMLRIFVSFGSAHQTSGSGSIFVSAVLTMFIGNLAALVQTNVKRMLAYSSIAHAGYILVAFAASTDRRRRRALLSCGLRADEGRRVPGGHAPGPAGRKAARDQDYAGLGIEAAGARRVLLAVSAFAAGLAGHRRFPREILRLSGGARCRATGVLVWLVVIAAINSVIGAYYYLRVIISMYFSEPRRTTRPPPSLRPSASRSSSPPSAPCTSASCPRRVLDFAKAAA